MAELQQNAAEEPTDETKLETQASTEINKELKVKVDQSEDENLKSSSSLTPTPSTTSSTNSSSNCILFYGVTYLGCSSVNAPKSESEINRIMSTLNEQGKVCIEVSMSVPQTTEEKIILFDSSSSNDTNSNDSSSDTISNNASSTNNTANIIAEYKMAHVLFVVRGGKNSPESNCFAFTTCHGDSIENLMFSCHVFRCKLVEAVSKILYSFWSVFNRQNIQSNQQQQLQQQTQNKPPKSGSISSSSAAGQLSSVASSLLGSLYGFGSLNPSAPASNSTNPQYSTYYNAYNCEQAAKFVNGRIEDQYVFKASVEIRELDARNSTFTSVPKEKEFFKLRKNLEKQINIQIQQLNNQPLEIERCFGVLMCQGRNVSHKDMQLLNTISMGRSDSSNSSGNANSSLANSTSVGGSGFASSLNNSNGYLVSALWNPLDTTTSTSLQVLNEETNKNARVFMTIAVDLVINGLQDPVRFCIETKARIFPQNDKFWVYQKNKHHEIFYLQIIRKSNDITSKQSDPSSPQSSSSNHIFNLQSIHSQTELTRKQNAIEHQKKISEQSSDSSSTINTTNTSQASDDENEVIMSGLGNVSKDCAEEELMDWSDLLSRWRKTTWNERPKGLQILVRKGIPEALRGEVWQLLAGCNDDEKKMNESYRVMLSKESSSENVILRDVNRTFPGHPFFQDESGQQALYKLSKAYSIYDDEVGYCQGLSFLIATLLLHMPEEQTFNLLVKIMYRYEIREIYKTNFECLHLRFFQLESLIREFLPDLNEHFIDLNIEAHMYASQWFLTLFTAKFPLYMVFRILDLFLFEGFLAIFSIALSLLKASQRDLLALDFEGVLKYFRVSMPKKYRSEQTFNLQLMPIWANIHSKLNEKKLKKYEKSYRLMKEAEELKENPLIRYERECKRLNNLVRRLEQENDDLANEYIESKINLSKQLEETRDDYELVKNELVKYKTDYQNKLDETRDTNKKLSNELDQVKKLWRKQSDKYENDLERNSVIIAEYKNICNTLSNKAQNRPNNLKRSNDERILVKESDLCENCSEKQKSIKESVESEVNNENNLLEEETIKNGTSENTMQCDKDSLDKIKNLELELARVKLELVDAQCKNQELDHILKSYKNSDSINYASSTLVNSNQTQKNNSNTDAINIMSTSTSSLTQYPNANTASSLATTPTTLNGSNNSINNSNNGNNWLSKTLTQFKEATNQVVQKAQKVNKTLSIDTNNN